MSFGEFCLRKIEPHAEAIASDPAVLGRFLRLVIGRGEMGQEELEQLFGTSVALAFAVWQHLAAVERFDLPASHLYGLATTHLRNPQGPKVFGWKTGSTYVLRGRAPWVTGTGIFDKLVVGFKIGDETQFGLIDFPQNGELLKLAALAGTSTVSLDFEGVTVDQILERKTTPSRYQHPEIGIAKRALRETASLAQPFAAARERLLKRIETLATSSDPDFEMSEIIRSSLRLWVLSVGGRALTAGSAAARFHLDSLLLDVLIQSDETLRNKLSL